MQKGPDSGQDDLRGSRRAAEPAVSQRTVKAIAVMHDKAFNLLLMRGDHSLNEIKAQKVLGTFRFASEAEIRDALGCKPGYIGPVGAQGRAWSPTARSRR